MSDGNLLVLPEDELISSKLFDHSLGNSVLCVSDELQDVGPSMGKQLHDSGA